MSLIADGDVAVGCGHGSANLPDGAQMRADDDAAEARRVAVDAEDGTEELDVGTGAPGVAVAARGVDIGSLAACRQAELEIAAP